MEPTPQNPIFGKLVKFSDIAKTTSFGHIIVCLQDKLFTSIFISSKIKGGPGYLQPVDQPTCARIIVDLLTTTSTGRVVLGGCGLPLASKCPSIYEYLLAFYCRAYTKVKTLVSQSIYIPILICAKNLQNKRAL